MIKAIVFDFAGVIASESFFLWLKDNVNDFERTKQFYLDLSYKADSGQMTGEEFAAVLAKKSGIPAKDVWPQIFQRMVINPQIVRLLVKLRKNYKVGLLTNHIVAWITEAIRRYRLTPYFDTIIISSKEKIIKPDPRIFRIMLKRLGVEPSETIFIDDREINVSGADKLGIKGLLYITDKKLIRDLKRFGIIF